MPLSRRLGALAALALIASTLSAFAQGTGESSGAADAAAVPITIRSLDFQVKGRTLAFVLRQKLEADGLVVGRSFPDLASFEAYLADRRQILLNNRVLASATADYELAPGPAGGSDAALHFAVEDTWNLIALPEPKYDSNSGLTLYVKGRDYNFAGSMQTLELDLSFVSDTASNKSFEATTTFALPFRALGSDWTFNFAEDLQFWTQGYAPRSTTSASLTLNVDGLGFPAYVRATQGFSYNALLPAAEPDPLFLSESLAFGATIPTGVSLGSLGALYYAPSLTVSQNWWPGTELAYAGRAGTVLAFGNGLQAGRADWVGNMREGTVLAASGSPSFNMQSDLLTWDFNAILTAYGSWLDRRLGLAARLAVLDRAMGGSQELGTYLRGILDARLYGVAGAFVNLGLPIKLFDFPAHLLIKKNWFDFELQAQPFVDAGIVFPDWSSRPSKSWLQYTGGLEFLVYPAVMRSFIVRASIGWDLKNVLATKSLTAKAPDGSSPYEIYFGTGLWY